MSRIFDALQRADAKRSGIGSSVEVRATELLKRVEHDFVLGNGAAPESDVQRAERHGVGQERSAHQDSYREPHLVRLRPEAEPLPEVFERFQVFKGRLAPTSKLVTVTQRESAAAEAFRLLAIRLTYLKHSRAMKRLLVTSSIPQEGKSLVAANLACALSRTDYSRTLLIEGDLRRPTLSSLFEAPAGNGITEILEGKCTPEDCICFLESAGMWLLPAGRTSINLQELMKSDQLISLVEEISSWFDWVVIDSPPMLPLADTSIWMRIAEGILLTVRQGKSERKALKSCIEALDQEKVIGALLNSATVPEHAYYSYRPSEPE